MIWHDGRWQKPPKTKNTYIDKVRQAKPQTELELWQAMTDQDYDKVAQLHKEYYQRKYFGGHISQSLKDAVSLIGRFRKYKRRFGIASEMDANRYKIPQPKPTATTWQEVWASMTTIDYHDAFGKYLKCKKFRGYNPKYGKEYGLIRTFRKHCRKMGIKYPVGQQHYPQDHIWREPLFRA